MALYTPLSPMPQMVTQPFEAAPRIFGALIGAGASLLGGALNRKSSGKQESRANAHNDPAAIRARYEAAGFDPLLGINNANPSYQQTYQPKFGNAVDKAVNGFLDRMQDNKILNLEKTRLELEVDKLRKDVKGAKIRPKVAGVFNGGFNGGSDATAANRHNSNGDTSIPDGRNPSSAVDTDPVKQQASIPIGFELHQHPDFAPSEIVENNQGEPAGWLYSPVKTFSDLGYTIGKNLQSGQDARRAMKFRDDYLKKKRNRNKPKLRGNRTFKPHFRQLIGN